MNEEVRQRQKSPGTAALLAVACLGLIDMLSIVGLQGVVSPARLQANSSSALVYTAQALGGSGWAKVMALALALSVIATTLTGIVLTARILYAMARDGLLPRPFALVSRRFSTPAVASIVVGLSIVGLAWIYMLATSVQSAFKDVVAVAGILFALFYICTAFAAIVFYRRRVLSSVKNMVTLGALPSGGRRVPRLDRRQVAAGRSRLSTLVARRSHRRGARAHDGRSRDREGALLQPAARAVHRTGGCEVGRRWGRAVTATGCRMRWPRMRPSIADALEWPRVGASVSLSTWPVALVKRCVS